MRIFREAVLWSAMSFSGLIVQGDTLWVRHCDGDARRHWHRDGGPGLCRLPSVAGPGPGGRPQLPFCHWAEHFDRQKCFRRRVQF